MGNTPTLQLAISGGHSRSSAFAFGDSSGAIAAVFGRPINRHVYLPDVVKRHFDELLAKLAHELEIDSRELVHSTRRAVFTFAGAASHHDQATLRYEMIEPAGFKPGEYEVVDDTWAGLLAGALSYRGICAFAGTGASVYVGRGGKPNSWEGKIDGWGPIIGDFGSGFQLSVDLFRELCRYGNRHGGESPPLMSRISTFSNSRESHLHPLSPDLEFTQRWFDALIFYAGHEWRIRFAKLAEAVTAAAEDGDSLAIDLVTKEASDMSDSLDIAFQLWPDAAQQPIVFQGGMFQHSNLYRRVVINRLTPICQGPVKLAAFRPIVGAALMAQFGSGVDPDIHYVHELEQSIRNLPESSKDVLLCNHPDAGFAHEVYTT